MTTPVAPGRRWIGRSTPGCRARPYRALRDPLVRPTAALIRLFGLSAPVLAAVDLAAYAAFLWMGDAAASCVGLLRLESTEPMFAEQRAAAFIAGAPGTVSMDRETTWRTRALLIRPGLLDRLASDPPPGALVAGEAGVGEDCPRRAAALPLDPGPGWTEAARSWSIARRCDDHTRPPRSATGEAAMINSLCILFSLTMVIYVVVRAAMLDAKRPWFQRAGPAEPLPDAAPGAARRRIPARR